MSEQVKKTILSMIPFYLAEQCPAFEYLMKAIEGMPDENFTRSASQTTSGVKQRIQYLLDEVFFFINQVYPITHDQGEKLDTFIQEIKNIFFTLFQESETMKTQIHHLQSCVETLQAEHNESKRLRTVAEVFTPLVQEIRSSMVTAQIPDSYYSESILRACLLRAESQSMSWEIAHFNSDNPRSPFTLDVFNQFESVLRQQADALRIDYQTAIELLLMKIDRNEIQHGSIKRFLRYQSRRDASFNEYLASMSMTDIFTINQKLCLETLYRRYFLGDCQRLDCM